MGPSRGYGGSRRAWGHEGKWSVKWVCICLGFALVWGCFHVVLGGAVFASNGNLEGVFRGINTQRITKGMMLGQVSKGSRGVVKAGQDYRFAPMWGFTGRYGYKKASPSRQNSAGMCCGGMGRKPGDWVSRDDIRTYGQRISDVHVGDLDGMKYRDLQSLAKDLGIKANQKAPELRKAIRQSLAQLDEGAVPHMAQVNVGDGGDNVGGVTEVAGAVDVGGETALSASVKQAEGLNEEMDYDMDKEVNNDDLNDGLDYDFDLDLLEQEWDMDMAQPLDPLDLGVDSQLPLSDEYTSTSISTASTSTLASIQGRQHHDHGHNHRPPQDSKLDSLDYPGAVDSPDESTNVDGHGRIPGTSVTPVAIEADSKGLYPVFVGNLPLEASEEDIEEFLGGNACLVELGYDPRTKQRQRYCIARYRSESAALLAIEMDGKQLHQHTLSVKPSHQTSDAAKRRSQNSCPLSHSEISRLVQQRAKARKNKQFEDADALRNRLEKNNVIVDDTLMTWRTSDGRSGDFGEGESSGGAGGRRGMVTGRGVGGASRRGQGGRGSGMRDRSKGWGREAQQIFARGECHLPDSAIKGLVDEIQEARMSKDYDLADSITSDLNQAGVAINDLIGVWATADGRRGSLPQSGGRERGRSEGLERGSRGGRSLETPAIYQLLRKRAKARQYRDYEFADTIRNQLEEGGVRLDDKKHMWFTSDGRSGPTDGKQDRDKFWGTSSTQKKMPGDWECASCGMLNFAKRTSCFKCNKPR